MTRIIILTYCIILFTRAQLFAQQPIDRINDPASIGLEYYAKGQLEEAEKILLKSIEYYTNHDTVTGSYILGLNILGDLNKNKEDFSSAKKYYKQCLNIIEFNFGKKNHKIYPMVLNNLGYVNFIMNDLDSAENAYKQSAIILNDLGENLPLAATLNNLGLLFKEKKEFIKSSSFYKKSLLIRKDILGAISQPYIQTINNLAHLRVAQQMFLEADSLFTEALHNQEKLSTRQSTEYTEILIDIAATKFKLGHFDKGNQIFQEALKLEEKLNGKYSDQYYTVLKQFEENLHFHDKYSQLIETNKLMLEILEGLNRSFSIEYAIVLDNLSSFYRNVGMYKEAVIANEKALKLFDQLTTNKNNDIDYWICFDNQLINYERNLEYLKALKLYESNQIEINNLKANPITSKEYNSILYSIGLIYKRLKKYDKAEDIYVKARAYFMQKYQTENIYILHNLARLYDDTRQFKKARPLYIKALKLAKQEHPFYLHILSNYLINCFALGEIDSFNENMSKYWQSLPMPYYNNIITTNKSVLRKISNDFYNQLCLNDSYFARIFLQRKHLDSWHFAHNAYKTMTFYAEQNIRKNLKSDASLQNKFEELQELRLKIKQLKINDKGYEDIYETLKTRLSIIENELAIQSNLFKINLTPLSTSEVVQSLGQNEVCIDAFATNDKLYFIVLNNNGITDWLIIPNDSLQFIVTSKDINQLYNNQNLYHYLLRKIEPYLKDKTTIYYSPDGILHRIAFHAIKTPSGETMGEKYTIKQISSSRSVFSKESEVIGSLTLFGGIDYSISDEKESREGQSNLTENFTLRNIENAIKKRGGHVNTSWDYLPGTLSEVQSIYNNYSTKTKRIYTDTTATERAFKKLSGQSPNCLFISTHGFYVPYEKQIIDTNRFSDRLTDDISIVDYSNYQDPMQRSGLIFAGANTSWTGSRILPEDNDGIVTAAEVVNMDLTNTKMVVLSACQTALGDITNGEGVYGLQRAFKQAGVEYIVASLWPVPDKDTEELMIVFFKHLQKNKLPYLAMQQARADMKKQGKRTKQYQGFVVIR